MTPKLVSMFCVFAAIAGCTSRGSTDRPPPGPPTAAPAEVEPVTVEFKNSRGVAVGTATLRESAGGVEIALDLRRIPRGTHAFHIHEKGACDGPKFTTAGPHFNPASKAHGKDNPKGSHAGDLPNVEASRDGVVKQTVTAAGVTLRDGELGLRRAGGTALMIHAKADDYRTDPTGDAGDRIACGVIEP